jgi:hypothetical protein
MCFSASASLIAGTALSGVGVASVKAVRKREYLPLAIIPLLFGAQQLIEGVIWLTFNYQLSSLNSVMTYIYAVFAFVLWPIFVPITVWKIETDPRRKKILRLFILVGVLVGGYLLYYHTLTPVTSQVVNKSIVYSNSHFHGFLVIGLYFIATIVSSLVSSHRLVNVFGVLAFFAAVVAYSFYAASFVSVWCFFAAVLSLMLYLQFRKIGNASNKNMDTPTPA